MIRRVHIALLAVALAVLCCAWPETGRAVQPDEILSDAAMENQARAISAELRCLVCQGQSIDDSDAPLARDLRILVRERLQAGDSRQQVLNFMVARYGDFVLLRPRLTLRTLLLWIAPVLLLFAGMFTFFFIAGVRTKNAKDLTLPPLTEAEKARLAEIMGSDKG